MKKYKIPDMKEMVWKEMKDLINRVAILTKLIRNKNRILEFGLVEPEEESESYIKEVATSSVPDLSSTTESSNDTIFGHNFEDEEVIEEILEEGKCIVQTWKFL